jgi:hypothetical protein
MEYEELCELGRHDSVIGQNKYCLLRELICDYKNDGEA